MDEDVNVMIVEPGKPTKLMKLPLALEVMEQEFQGTTEVLECVVPTYDLTMCCSGGKVIPCRRRKISVWEGHDLQKGKRTISISR